MISIDSGRLSWLCIRTSRYTKPTKRCTRFKIVLTLQLNGWSPLGLCLPENCRLTQYRRPAILLAFLGRPETPSPTGPARPREKPAAGCPGGGPKAAIHSGLESALGSHPCGALSSYQASSVYGNRRSRRQTNHPLWKETAINPGGLGAKPPSRQRLFLN